MSSDDHRAAGGSEAAEKSRFVEMMDSFQSAGLAFTENGDVAVSEAGLGSSLMAIFDKAVRGAPAEETRDRVRAIFENGTLQDKVDMCCLAFQTRDPRLGKGERRLGLTMFLALPVALQIALAKLIPVHGSWKDVRTLLTLPKALAEDEEGNQEKVSEPMQPQLCVKCYEFFGNAANLNMCSKCFRGARGRASPPLGVLEESVSQELVALFADALRRDMRLVEARAAASGADATEGDKDGFVHVAAADGKRQGGGLSLVGKYALRERVGAEKKVLKRVFSQMADVFGAQEEQPYKKYRCAVAGLRESLRVTEVYMSSGRWAAIVPKEVPSECGRRHRKAFLNEKDGSLGDAMPATGDRFPDDPGRVACRENFLEAAQKKGGLKSTVVTADALCRDARRARTESERSVVDAQAESHIEHVRKGLEEKAREMAAAAAAAEGAKGAGEGSGSGSGSGGRLTLGQIVPVCDVSGSMSGIPMEACIGLGLIVSRLAHPAFSNRILTFHSNPSWVAIDPAQGWCQNVMELAKAPWGNNTDFEKTVVLLMERLEAVQPPLQPAEVPGLLVFSDMQFDHAGGKQWETQCDKVKESFRALGRRLVGQPYELQLTFWNLRGDTKTYVTQSDTTGVTMLSGFSTNLLKTVLEGGLSTNPLDMLYKILRHETFDDVRKIATDVLTSGG